MHASRLSSVHTSAAAGLSSAPGRRVTSQRVGCLQLDFPIPLSSFSLHVSLYAHYDLAILLLPANAPVQPSFSYPLAQPAQSPVPPAANQRFLFQPPRSRRRQTPAPYPSDGLRVPARYSGNARLGFTSPSRCVPSPARPRLRCRCWAWINGTIYFGV